MLQIIQDFIPKGNGNRPGYAMKPEYITIHNTANTSKGANALMHARYVKNPSTATSWHFTVDDTRAVQHLPLNENGWHAGDGAHGTGNRKSIGIEVCENSDGNFEKAFDNAAQLVAKLMKDTGIPITKVVPHKHWSGKQCPRRILPRWGEFISRVKYHYDKLTMPAQKPAPSNPKGEGNQVNKFEPNSPTIKNSAVNVLKRLAAKDGGISDMWAQKLEKGELTDSDAIGLLYVAIERGLIEGEKEAVKVEERPVSPSLKENWDWAKEKGILDGTRANYPLTREQAAAVAQRVYKLIKSECGQCCRKNEGND